MHFASLALLSLSVLATANETPITAAAELETPTPTANAPVEIPIADLSEDELKRRQAPGQVVGQGVPNSPDPTQMSPVTTFLSYGPDGKQTPVVYTQTFAKVLDQWDPPKSGAIGLGDIPGQIGLVKTKARRNYIAEATAAVKRGVHALERRKKKGSSSSGGSAASGITVPVLTVAAGLATGVLALLL